MKKQLCTIALSGMLALGMSAAASAQDSSMQQQPQGGTMQSGSMDGQGKMHHHGAMDPDAQLAHMTKRYNLTADQQSQLKPILADHQQQMMAMRSDTSMSKEDKMAKMQSMRQDHMQKVEAILTPDQKTKFEQDQAKMQQKHENRMSGGGAMGGAGSQPQ